MKLRPQLDTPNLGKIEKKYLAETINKGFVSTFGPYVSQFEKKIAKFLRVKKAVSTQSGTAALHVALYELGIGPGDEVIVPALTFVATVSPVVHVGAKPVFVDVNRKTWNMDPEKIKKNITKRTKAIIPVHFYGNPCDMHSIMRIAKKHKIFVIEDATESLGAKYKRKHTGTIGDFGCLSFNGNKTITTGGGGMVTGKNTHKLEHIRFLVNQARDESHGYYYPEVGFNYRMTNLEAALGLAQLERLNGFLAKKRKFHAIYKKELSSLKEIRFQEEYENAESSWWFTALAFTGKTNISLLQKKLREKNVYTRRVFMPVTEFPPYRKYKRGSYTNTYDIYNSGLCFPSSTLNSEKDIYYVCKILKRYI